jgi:hypothetical protein
MMVREVLNCQKFGVELNRLRHGSFGRLPPSYAKDDSLSGKRMRHIRLARCADREAINRLRVEEYRRAPEFTLLNEAALLWDGADAGRVVLSAWEGLSCVATMQAEVADDAAQAATILGVSLPPLADVYPALVLTRAATDREYSQSGLNSALRRHALSAASALRSAIGVVYEGAPRSNVLKRIGYELLPLTDAWTAALHPIRPGQLAVLHGQRFPEAVRLLDESFGTVLAAFPWSGAPLALAPDRPIR